MDCHLIHDVFPNDPQEVTDEDWIRYGCTHGWAALTKDTRIRRRPQFHVATRPIFALSDGNLPIAEMVRRFDRQRTRIWRAASSEQREFWVVYDSRIMRQYPR
jgi:PIN like domain